MAIQKLPASLAGQYNFSSRAPVLLPLAFVVSSLIHGVVGLEGGNGLFRRHCCQCAAKLLPPLQRKAMLSFLKQPLSETESCHVP